MADSNIPAMSPADLPWRTRALCAEAVERDLRDEVDRLQAIEDAAREAIHPDDCDDDRGYSPTCRRDVPDYPEEWCPTCRLAAALEADRG